MTYFNQYMSEKIVLNWNRIQAAADEAFKFYSLTTTMKRLSGGLLIEEIINHMISMSMTGKNEILSTTTYGERQTNEPKKFLHYSAHDSNIATLLGILESVDQMSVRPDYGSSVILELHQDRKFDEWFVKVFYLHNVPGEPVELELKSCKKNEMSRCTLGTFIDMVNPYRVDSWISWMRECNNNIFTTDPYKN